MASTLSKDDRKYLECLLKKAKPYTEKDPEYNMWDGHADPDRKLATAAKKILDSAT